MNAAPERQRAPPALRCRQRRFVAAQRVIDRRLGVAARAGVRGDRVHQPFGGRRFVRAVRALPRLQQRRELPHALDDDLQVAVHRHRRSDHVDDDVGQPFRRVAAVPHQARLRGERDQRRRVAEVSGVVVAARERLAVGVAFVRRMAARAAAAAVARQARFEEQLATERDAFRDPRGGGSRRRRCVRGRVRGRRRRGAGRTQYGEQRREQRRRKACGQLHPRPLRAMGLRFRHGFSERSVRRGSRPSARPAGSPRRRVST